MKKAQSFSIVIPILNEELFINKFVSKLIEEIRKRRNLAPFKYEILLIENGSEDKSYEECLKLEEKYDFIKTYQLKFPSYGQALKKGFLKSKYPIVVFFNLDFWDIDFLEKGLKLIKTNDLVLASKTLISSQDERPFGRRMTTYFFNLFLKVVYNFPLSDTHGLKVMRRDKILSLVKRCYTCHLLFDTELILRCCKEKLILTELPIRVREVRPSRFNNNYKMAYIVLKDLLIIFKLKYVYGFINRR
jgi:glycosyltransferase involved in cell wall biosynthesis